MCGNDRSSLLLLACLTTSILMAQVDVVEVVTQRITDDNILTTSDLEILQDELYYYLDNPMSVQLRDPDELSKHPLITFIEAVNITYYTSSAGDFLDWGELTNVYGIDADWVKLRQPFLSLGRPAPEWISSMSSIDVVQLSLGVKTDDPKKRGYLEQAYAGPAFQDQGRLRLEAGPFTGGLRWQRDAGEDWNEQGFDHISGYLLWTPSRKTHFSIGTHRLGQFTGLLRGGSFFSALPSGPNIHPKGGSTRPSDGANENELWNGLYGSHTKGKWQYSGFVGSINRDARIEDQTILSLPTGGIHRTITEIERRKNALFRTLQGQIRYNEGYWNLAYAAHLTTSELVFDERRHFGGQSIYLQWVRQHTYITSEWAMDLNGELALNAAMSYRAEKVEFGIRGHRIGRDYRSSLAPTNSPFINGSDVCSSTGFMTFHFSSISTSFALYHALQANTGKIRSGYQVDLSQKNYTSNWSLNWRTRRTENETRRYGRGSIEWVSGFVKTRFRTDLHFSKPSEISVAISGQFTHQKGTLKTRLLVFSHRAFTGLPLYLMLPSTTLQMRIGALHGNGAGSSVVLEKSWGSHKIQLSVQYDRRTDVNKRGSGLDERLGADQWQIGLEYHLKLDLRT